MTIQELMTVANLKAWLLTQDSATKYDYCNGKDCLLARFLKAHEIEFISVRAHWVNVKIGEFFRYPWVLNDISVRAEVHSDSDDYYSTYGGALEVIEGIEKYEKRQWWQFWKWGNKDAYCYN